MYICWRKYRARLWAQVRGPNTLKIFYSTFIVLNIFTIIDFCSFLAENVPFQHNSGFLCIEWKYISEIKPSIWKTCKNLTLLKTPIGESSNKNLVRIPAFDFKIKFAEKSCFKYFNGFKRGESQWTFRKLEVSKSNTFLLTIEWVWLWIIENNQIQHRLNHFANFKKLHLKFSVLRKKQSDCDPDESFEEMFFDEEVWM